jgi:hypothetical protein
MVELLLDLLLLAVGIVLLPDLVHVPLQTKSNQLRDSVVSLWLAAFRSSEILQLELCQFGLVEVVPQLEPVLGEANAGSPGESCGLIIRTQHLDVLRPRHKLARKGLQRQTHFTKLTLSVCY